jgi:hypothetical protein
VRMITNISGEITVSRYVEYNAWFQASATVKTSSSLVWDVTATFIGWLPTFRDGTDRFSRNAKLLIGLLDGADKLLQNAGNWLPIHAG